MGIPAAKTGCIVRQQKTRIDPGCSRHNMFDPLHGPTIDLISAVSGPTAYAVLSPSAFSSGFFHLHAGNAACYLCGAAAAPIASRKCAVQLFAASKCNSALEPAIRDSSGTAEHARPTIADGSCRP